MIVAALEYCGYVSLEASTGEEALEAAAAALPMLVVLDVHLPGISGYEVCRAFREEFGDTLPIIFVSGERTMSFDRFAGFLIGGDDYLVKPFALDDFVARIRRHLERRSRQTDRVGVNLVTSQHGGAERRNVHRHIASHGLVATLVGELTEGPGGG